MLNILLLTGHQVIKKVIKIFHLLAAQIREQDKVLGMAHHSKTMGKTQANGRGARMVKQLQQQPLKAIR